jgi:hypothetical protein
MAEENTGEGGQVQGYFSLGGADGAWGGGLNIWHYVGWCILDERLRDDFDRGNG